MADRDGNSGRYQKTYPLDEFVDALEDPGESEGTQEAADAVECKYRIANAKLHDLKYEGRESARKVGDAYLRMLAEVDVDVVIDEE